MISSLASVHPKAKIGNNVTIEPFAMIYADVVIGDNCWIGSNVVIFDGARIGNDCKFFPGAVISAVPQDLKYNGEPTTTEIGNGNIIRECVTINKGTVASGKTVIGDKNLLMAYVHVAHDCFIGNHCILANGVTLAGHIEIEDHAIIGGLSAIHQFVRIGKHVMISGGSLVRKDVPPFTKCAHEPLSYVGVNAVGLRRRGYTNDQINVVQSIYRLLFVQNHSVKKGVEEIEAGIEATTERDEVLSFISKSQRGLMKGYVKEEEE
ncbi:MAG: acyl-ACP--UDP-N-acetylglucosamine O-acyltransferase [Bacteroidetes bacterium]|nr:acyl-ACP--UDP-N-acetylglucosamine O-acyltransferase [Bacteroidota bacterium]HNR19771.1 acyl-ACP--UDP-N-acetylglucosamine O-acyltransferase [Bacteroidia bacterium]HNU34126.1 acyl-ACP--UDP-N-acetylglucosamine O-acyltransferase [Bacteroidia bacterium]